jgi:GWxTD domain-containing protein
VFDIDKVQKMKNRSIRALILLFCFCALSVTLGYSQEDAAHRLYLQAKKFSFNQQWREASELFAQLVKDYPKSPYCEEAHFWVGYSLEKAGEFLRAYDAFEKMMRLYPSSAWLDDAVSHQVMLAEKLAQKRGDRYYLTLRKAMESQENEAKYPAAMALARLGDRRALPVLKSLRGQPLYDQEAEKLVQQLETAMDLPDETAVTDGGGPVGLQADGGEAKSAIQFDAKDDKINYFQEHRFEQYRSMTRKDDSWTRDELVDFAVWHILPTDQFDEYASLDRQRRGLWLDEFWKKHDPTPATVENECREEFERRVDYARSQFNYFDRMKDFYYAPWDARGEVYVKFGQPEKRTTNDEGEFWYYSIYNQITFFIRPHVTNIFGRSIFISSLDNKSMRSIARPSDRLKWRNFHNEYIFQPGFYFTLHATK